MATSVKESGIQGSDEVLDIFCEMCLKDGTKSEAYAFCVDCTEYFCSTCLKYHKKFLKDHVMLEGEKMPTDAERCSLHKQIIKFYCRTCNKFACESCKNDHKLASKLTKSKHNCCSLSLVSELSKDIEDNKEFKDFIMNFDKIVTKTAELSKKTMALQSVDTQAKHEVQKVTQTFHAKANTIERAIEKRTNKNKVQSAALTTKFNALSSKMEIISYKIKQRNESIRTQRSNTYITMKQLESEIKTMERELNNVNLELDKLIFSFVPDTHINVITEEVQNLGTLMSIAEINAQKQKRQIPAHKYDICDDELRLDQFCVVPGQIIAGCDRESWSVKIFDAEDKEEMSTLQFNSPPTAITYTENREFAVAQNSIRNDREGTVTFLVWPDRYTLHFKGRHFKTELVCRDIIYCRKQFIVLMYNQVSNLGMIKVLDMYGKVLRTFNNKPLQPDNFSKHSLLTLDKRNNILYVSNPENNQLTSIRLDKKVKPKNRTRTHVFLSPNGVSADDNECIFISSDRTNEIVYWNPKTGEQNIILDKQNGFLSPHTIRYCEEDELLYIQAWDKGSIIKVYDMTEKQCVWNEKIQKVGRWEPI